MYVITGMHRSGTSLVAQLFCHAGADMGDPESFYRPDRWNPDGYFEQPDIHAINMPLINGPWGRLAYFRLPSTKRILARAHSRHDEIAETAAKYDGKVLKETRFCLTLPAWLEHGATVRGLLVCLRDPVAVAQSLKRRNHISLRRGFGLWYEHLSRLLNHAGSLPIWFVRYENLLSTDGFVQEMSPAFEFFQLTVGDATLESLRSEAVKTDWNHHTEQQALIPDHASRLWRDLLARHAQQFQGSATAAATHPAT